MVSFFCVLAPEGMNSIVFGKKKGKKSEGMAYPDTVSAMLNLFKFH